MTDTRTPHDADEAPRRTALAGAAVREPEPVERAYVLEGETLLAARTRWDVRGNDWLAGDLEARAAALRSTTVIPEDERRPYEDVVRSVLSSTSGYPDHKLGKLCRRIWTTGECLWHASWVLHGAGPEGCPCSPCQKARGGR